MLRAVLFIAAALLLVVSAAGAILYRGTSLVWLQPAIEREVSRRLGRELRLTGPPYLQIRDESELRIPGLTLANTSWAGDAPLAALEGVSVRVRTSSLFSPPIIIEHIDLDRGDVKLATDANGRSNLPGISSTDPTESKDEPEGGPVVVVLASDLREFRVRRTHPRRETVEFFLASLLQSSDGERTTLAATGRLQERPWSLSWNGSALVGLLNDKAMEARFDGSLADLYLAGTLALPSVDRLKDLTLQAELTGTVPERIAALSSLIDPEDPMRIHIDIADIDPGVALKLAVDVAGLEMEVTGELARPAKADGVDLAISVDAASLPRLTEALALGDTDDVPLRIEGKLLRDGRAIQFSDLDISAGDHRIIASGKFPEFPHSDNAWLSLEASGPEFAFYQRMFKRPRVTAEPYRAKADLSADDSGVELLRSTVAIGDHQVTLRGPVGDYPTFNGSDVEIQLTGPSLAFIGDQFDVDLPPEPYAADATVNIAEDLITISDLSASVTGIDAHADGTLTSYPALDQLDLRIALDSPSLAASSSAWGRKALGDIKGGGRAHLTGSAKNLSVTDLRLNAGASSLRSEAGSLSFSERGLRSDIALRVHLEGLPELLGEYADGRVLKRPLSFALQPSIADDLISLTLDDISGDGIRGSAALQIGADLQLDERTNAQADLNIASVDALLPEIEGYQPPDGALRIQAQTLRDRDKRDLRFELQRGDAMVVGSLIIPLDKSPATLTVLAEGARLRDFGDIDAFPSGPLPFRIEADARLSREEQYVELADLTVANTTAQGQLRLRDQRRDLWARLELPRADLGHWLENGRDTETTPEDSSSEDRYLIPDLALPLAWLSDYRSDLEIHTGPLGLRDRLLGDRSLIDSLTASLKSGGGQAVLRIDELRGSRGAAMGELTLNAGEHGADARVTLTARDAPLGLGSADNSTRELPRYDIDLTLAGKGNSTRDLATSLDGALLMVGGEGRLEDLSFSFATESFLAQLTSTLIPTIDKKPDMEVQCTVLAARAAEGNVSLDPGFVFRTRRVDMSARGDIDLRSEKLRIRFDNQARKGLGISAASLVNPYVQITGTLAAPSLGLDITNSALAGGAAAATGGLTVIAKPLIGRFLRRGNPCKAALNRWNKDGGLSG